MKYLTVSAKIKQQVKISRLLHEIEDASLQNILRDIIFMEKNVFDAIKTHRPETIIEKR